MARAPHMIMDESRCGVCSHGIKTGIAAVFTAECKATTSRRGTTAISWAVEVGGSNDKRESERIRSFERRVKDGGDGGRRRWK
ncbi:Os03g0593400 [Oryza sativa Japonica Group]|uniref:Os03g0593400 protein n=1 Tax=Oryza sativa subsp. japonica TaxID=39947 RepID=A0A0P0W0H0_ORYSJ|nr:Os03g0593400 [Oryza sativa Japonica Group]